MICIGRGELDFLGQTLGLKCSASSLSRSLTPLAGKRPFKITVDIITLLLSCRFMFLVCFLRQDLNLVSSVQV